MDVVRFGVADVCVVVFLSHFLNLVKKKLKYYFKIMFLNLMKTFMILRNKPKHENNGKFIFLANEREH